MTLPSHKEPTSSSASQATTRPHISWRYIAASLALSVVAMSIVIVMTYTPGTLEHLKPKRFPGLFLALGVSALRIYLGAARLKLFSDGQLTWPGAFRLILSWDFASAVTPSTIGGAPVATYAMTREGVSLGKSTIIMMFGVLLDHIWYSLAVPLLLITGLYFEVIPEQAGVVGGVTMILIYIALIGYGGLLTYGLLVNPSSLKSMVKQIFRLPLLRRVKEKALIEAENLEAHSNQIRSKPLVYFAKALGLTLAMWLCRIALPVIVILSLLPANEVMLVLRSLAMHLSFVAVPTPGGSGGVEGLFVLFLGPLIDRAAFIGLAVFLWRMISYYISIGLGMFAFSWYARKG